MRENHLTAYDQLLHALDLLESRYKVPMVG